MKVKDRSAAKRQESNLVAKKSEGKATASENGANDSKVKADTSKTTADEILKSAGKVIPMVSAIDRLNRLEQFQHLKERFDFLKGKENELKNFGISQDGTAAQIILECTGAKVLVTNSNIIEKVVKLCENELNILLAKTEREVIDFVI